MDIEYSDKLANYSEVSLKWSLKVKKQHRNWYGRDYVYRPSPDPILDDDEHLNSNLRACWPSNIE